MAHVRPHKFAHVVYRTHRFEEMLEWYQRVFDANIQHQNPALAFLSYDGEHHRFAIANLDVLRPEDEQHEKQGLVGVDHVAYTYASLDDLLDNYEQLKEQGITPYWCVHHGITASLYYRDPDGNQMEFQVDCFESGEDAVGFMQSPAFASNPVGVEFYPEEWLAKRRAGVPATELIDMPAGEVSPIRGALGG